MSKAEQLLRNSAIAESTARRPAPSAMFSAPSARQDDARDEGVSRSKVAQVIRLDRIVRDPGQPREEFDEEALGRLAGSMKARGVLQPIAVRWDEGRGAYVVVVGERRWRAAGIAGLESIPCTVMDDRIAPDELLAIQCLENLSREDLRPIEQAKAFRSLMEIHGWSGRRVAEEVGVSQPKVVQALSLLALPASLQDAVERGGVGPTVALEIGKLDDPDEQAEMAAAVVEQKLTRSEVAAAVQAIKARRPAPAARPEPVTIDVEETVVTVKWRKAGPTTAVQALRKALKLAQERERAGDTEAA